MKQDIYAEYLKEVRRIAENMMEISKLTGVDISEITRMGSILDDAEKEKKIIKKLTAYLTNEIEECERIGFDCEIEKWMIKVLKDRKEQIDPKRRFKISCGMW